MITPLPELLQGFGSVVLCNRFTSGIKLDKMFGHPKLDVDRCSGSNQKNRMTCGLILSNLVLRRWSSVGESGRSVLFKRVIYSLVLPVVSGAKVTKKQPQSPDLALKGV